MKGAAKRPPQAVEMAAELLDFDRVSLSAVGRVGSEERYRELLDG